MVFVCIGFAVGLLGTLVGAGGGFLVVPALMLLFGFPAAEAAGTSLAMVLFGAAAGSLAYARQRRVDYAGGILFALATYPGAILGARLTAVLSSRLFSALFGTLLGLVALWMLCRPPPGERRGGAPPAQPAVPPLTWRQVDRRLEDATGEVHRWSYRPAIGVAVSMAVGFISSLLGIGGGIIHVPALIYLLHYPAHLATATSHFVLAWSALVGLLMHLAEGNVRIHAAMALGIGAACGAPLGAWLACRINPRQITAALALALLLAATRLLWP